MSNANVNATATIKVLHDTNTATQDVLKGYRELAMRAEPEIQVIVRRLIELHERHAAEQSAELVGLRAADEKDASIQGTVNKMVVILRDWVSNLDRDVLPAVRDGEEALLEQYEKAFEEEDGRIDPRVVSLLSTQAADIGREIARLPAQ